MAKKRAKKKQKNAAMPAKFRRVNHSTGWLRADAVKFLKRRGQPAQVLIRRRRRTGKKRAKR